ncbi:FecR domain-containing protein [Algoriphagus sp. AGSA1]|uniref:FecR family protein n=1 Tax=Algoriphagus sp. AGSA1 TaxID=2907213 RepID=UPI001F457932|nr:FecR domain-containing protein [Algoriphagus sp. AGSA1]MCE7055218.1 FecR domain-containing protein [Algoriphagus sp. AGSA1]
MSLENFEYFEKYLLEQLSTEEVSEFEKKLRDDAQFAQEYRCFLGQLDNTFGSKGFNSADKNSAWQKVITGIYIPSSGVKPITQRSWSWGRAASVTIIMCLGLLAFWLYRASPEKGIEMVTKSTVEGQKATITLADGTTVRLNSSSSVSYPVEFSDSTRKIMLSGEAFFEVTSDKSRPFIISSGQLETKVLGTSFNIRSFPDEKRQEVAVKSGTVQVAFPVQLSDPVNLQVGDVVIYDNASSTMELEKVDPESIALWTQGYIYFENETLGQVLKSLSRWYGVEFSVEDPRILNCRVTLKQRDETLKNILEILKYASYVEYEFNENQMIIIKGKPC